MTLSFGVLGIFTTCRFCFIVLGFIRFIMACGGIALVPGVISSPLFHIFIELYYVLSLCI